MSMDIFGPVWTFYKELNSRVDWSSAAVYGGLILVSWLFYKWALQPFLSPLRKVPGMPYNPLVGNLPDLMKGEGMEATIKMMEKYGPIFRYHMLLGAQRLGLADPELIRHVTVTNNRNYVKPPFRLYMMKLLLGNGLVTSEGDVHAVHKRLMSPAFNNQAIAKMVPIFENNITKLVNYWKEKMTDSEGHTEVNIAADLARTTLDIIGSTAFGYEFNSLEQPDFEVTQAFSEIISGAGFSFRMMIPFYFYLPVPDSWRFRKNIRIMNKVVHGIIKRKRELLAGGSDQSAVVKDVLGMMMVARDEATGQGLSDEELRDQVMTLMVAGHETTAVAMSWCLLMLASHPEIQEKAREEVLSQLQEDEPLTVDSIEKLQYCGTIIKETLRLMPPIPITIRQALKADVLPGKIQVPAGTVMTLCIGPMMRRPDIFEDPNSFRPERFENKETEATFHHFLPFLIGPRMCLGYKFALIELRVMLATFLRQLRFDAIPGIQYKRKFAITMKPDPPLKLRISHYP